MTVIATIVGGTSVFCADPRDLFAVTRTRATLFFAVMWLTALTGARSGGAAGRFRCWYRIPDSNR